MYYNTFKTCNVYMRTINLTVQIEDADWAEAQFYNWIEASIGDAIIDIKTLPKTDKLKDKDKHFRKMLSELSKQRKALNDYINKHNYE